MKTFIILKIIYMNTMLGVEKCKNDDDKGEILSEDGWQATRGGGIV